MNDAEKDAQAREMFEIDDDFHQAIELLNERELQDKLFLLATLLRLVSEKNGSSKRAGADYVLGYLKSRPGGYTVGFPLPVRRNDIR